MFHFHHTLFVVSSSGFPSPNLEVFGFSQLCRTASVFFLSSSSSSSAHHGICPRGFAFRSGVFMRGEPREDSSDMDYKNKNRSVNISCSSLGWSIIISNINQAWGTSELYWHKVVAIQTWQCSKVHTIMTEGQYSTVGLEQVRSFIAYYMELGPLTCLFWFCQLSQTKIQIHGL